MLYGVLLCTMYMYSVWCTCIVYGVQCTLYSVRTLYGTVCGKYGTVR